MLTWTTTDQAAASQGLAALIYGESSMGKTTLAATLDPSNTVILSAEAGLLSLRKHKITAVEIHDLDELNQAFDMVFSPSMDWVKNVVLDSLTEIAEQILANRKTVRTDARQAYGDMADGMVEIAKKFRDAPGKNKFLLCKQEFIQDETSNLMLSSPAMPGKKVGPQLPYLFDEVFKVGIGMDPTTKKSFRYIQTRPDVNTRAKDRSGALEMYEPFELDPATGFPVPGTGLANIIAKITSKEGAE